MLLLLLGHRRRGVGGHGGSLVGAGEGQYGVGIVDDILVVMALGLRRRRRIHVLLELRLVVLLLVVLDLGAQRALAGWGQAALGSEDSLDVVKALLDVLETLVDDGIDALVDDGGEGVGQGCQQVGNKEPLLGWIRHLI